MINSSWINIIHKNNKITIKNMNHWNVVCDFTKACNECISSGFNEINIICECTAVFPNACVPIAAAINHYKQICGIKFNFEINPGYLTECGLTESFSPTAEQIKTSPFNKIVEYIPDQVHVITASYIDAIMRIHECNNGVIDGLTWCLSEVMDNVFTHSECDKGFVMVQFHAKTKHLSICVADQGKGIFSTLKGTPHHPTCALDAISLSVQEGIGDGNGQGNGLFGLLGIVQSNSGSLQITSNGSLIRFCNFNNIGEPVKHENLAVVSDEHPGTIVDFGINLTENIDIKQVFRNIGGFDGFDFRIDGMWHDDSTLLYNVFENSGGTVTRQAGNALLNDVVNIFIRQKSHMILDFTEINTVSSSFIDEFIAKLVLRFGIVDFVNNFKIKGMNDTIKHLCNRSINMRISEEWKNMLQNNN